MFSLVGRLALVSLCVLCFGGSAANGGLRPIRESKPEAVGVPALTALFSNSTTANQLKNFRTISDGEVVDLKESVRSALVAAGLKELSRLKAEDLQIGYDPFYGIKVMSEGHEVELYVQIRPSGEAEPRHYKSESTKKAWKLFLNTQIFMAQSQMIRPEWENGRGFFRSEKMIAIVADAIAQLMPLTIDGKPYKYYIEEMGGKITAVFRHENYNLTWSINEDGMVLFGSDMRLDAAGTVRLNPRDAAHVNQGKLQEILSTKPSELSQTPRISAMFDALAVLMADDRFQIEAVKATKLGSAKGLSRTPIEVLGLQDIDFGTLELQMTDGSSRTLKFAAGHFHIGTDLNKVRGWLYGEGEVGDQVGFYQQLGSAN